MCSCRLAYRGRCSTRCRYGRLWLRQVSSSSSSSNGECKAQDIVTIAARACCIAFYHSSLHTHINHDACCVCTLPWLLASMGWSSRRARPRPWCSASVNQGLKLAPT